MEKGGGERRGRILPLSSFFFFFFFAFALFRAHPITERFFSTENSMETFVSQVRPVLQRASG